MKIVVRKGLAYLILLVFLPAYIIFAVTIISSICSASTEIDKSRMTVLSNPELQVVKRIDYASDFC